MGDGGVISLYGHATGERFVSDAAVEVLRSALERAEAGEVIGVVVCELWCDGLSSYRVAGRVGGYSMIGALTCACGDLEEIARGED